MSAKAAPAPRMHTVRFSQVVASSGKPRPHLMLTAPEHDKALLRLVTKTRVMTVHQAPRRGGKDYGTVGLHRTPGAQVLVFPKSLRRHADKRVVGINYDLLAEPAATAGAAAFSLFDTPPKRLRRATAVAAATATDNDTDDASPVTLRDVLCEIRRARRLLGARRLVATRELLSQLGKRLARTIAQES